MKKIVALLSGIALVGTACSSMYKDDRSMEAQRPVSATSREVARAEDAAVVTEFKFQKGSARLDETAKQDLRRIINEAERKGELKELKVVTWADAEYPSASEKKLSKAQIDLVKKRNEAIKDFVKSYDRKIDVDSYSMAERPNKAEELFKTSDARIKKSLEEAGIPHADSDLKHPSRASKSVIMAITR